MPESNGTGITVECVWEARTLLGEGPLWSPSRQALYAVDSKGSRILCLPVAGERQDWKMEEPCYWLVERQDGDGFIAGLKTRVVHLRLDGDRPEIVADIVRPEPQPSGNRLNDAKVDAAGRLWFGTMDEGESDATGSFYRLDPDGTCTRMDQDYTVSNGPAFSRDGRTLYHTDSPARTIYAFDLGADGSLTNKRVHIRLGEEDGFPDGMTTDAEGGLWVAHWDGGRITRFQPDGSPDRSIAIPASRVTSCAFGGPDMNQLYVTTAAFERLGEPQAGGLFRINTGFAGMPANRFG